MPLEATIICLDNSEWMRNGDFQPSRLKAQQAAANIVTNAKTQQHPESAVGILNMAGKGVEVLVAPTGDIGKIFTATKSLEVGGKVDLLGALQVASLALRHRMNKHQAQRIVVFAGSPIEGSQAALVRLAKKLKKNKVAVDIVNFGEEATNAAKLEAFISAVSSNGNSHLVTVPAGPHVLADIIISSPIVYAGEGEGAPSMMVSGEGGGGEDWSELGIDPNADPELAMAIRLSLDEARKEKERRDNEEQQKAGKTTDTAAPAVATDAKTTETTARPDDSMEQDDDLAAALAMSIQQPSGGVGEGMEVDDFGETDEDDELRLALQMSMDTPATTTTASTAATTASRHATDEDAIKDPAFLSDVLSSLSGVDQDDERLKSVLLNIQKESSKKDDDKKKDEGKK